MFFVSNIHPHKKKFCVYLEFSTVGDPWGRDNLLGLYKQFPHLKPLHPVGRLDCDTSGLLLFSSDGKLTNQLLDPSNAVPRVYEAIVSGAVDPDRFSQILSSGVATADGTFPAHLVEAFPIPAAAQVNSPRLLTVTF
ncbi:hypothetical protein EON65_41420 [archaeon]|nr:MAG: hypothetical protein EON65_41420 [archaeon]